MRASDEALASSGSFLGQRIQPSLDGGVVAGATGHPLPVRAALVAEDVPQDDVGLRLLAANGDWASVVALADKLEDEAARKNARHAQKVVGGCAVVVPPAMASTAARLPYVLVQVTAYIKMQRMGAAKKLLDTLGDLEGESYRYTTASGSSTSENFAPFSLRFLAALMPYYLGVPAQSKTTLYRLLYECEQRQHTGDAAAASPPTAEEAGGGDAALWRHRACRVRRALIFLHQSAGQFDLALQHFDALIAATGEGRGDGEGTAVARVRRVLQLQQFACVCLHGGAELLAQSAFHQVDAESGRESEEGTGTVLGCVRRMNDGFLEAFYGRFSEAAAIFRDVAADAQRERDQRSGSIRVERRGEEGEEEEGPFFTAVLEQLLASAQTSEVTCGLYCLERANPHTAIQESVASAEGKLRANPALLIASDAFLADLVRLYTLSGDRQPQLDRLAHLLEVFRCDAASLPNLDKLL